MNPLDANNFVVVPNFFTPQEADYLAQEMYKLERQNLMVFDPQAPNSPAIYNFLPLVKQLVKKVPKVSEVVGEDVLPTYVYARIYKNGADLKRHRDRDSCEVSLTVNLQKDSNWPIWIQKPDGSEVSVELNPGDAMMYLGCVADHWRDVFTGANYVQTFMHYVKANGPCAYTFFDIVKRR